MAWVLTRLCKLQKGCTRLAAASDKVYQLFAHGRWFSLGTPASSTNKTEFPPMKLGEKEPFTNWDWGRYSTSKTQSENHWELTVKIG
jgi:hypothetical protein